ncbi:PP2C family protein-serine/threonine phosphatase [Yoonia vestfoldensis]|uniref:PP2C family protein-serine/threonine phosphatase n=1 Tax=Yoonia vestfoldensis TaxID=245188 RepID=UPI00035CDC59|nr:protein phosphatase 2C domain-containing protein [Yoonia vestfoldensis]
MLDLQSTGGDAVRLDVAIAAIKGSRDYQEDTVLSGFALGQSSGFAVVADGVGGHSAGDVASAIVATEMFCQIKLHESALNVGLARAGTVLRDAAEAANRRLAAHVAAHEDTFGMASTVLVPMIRNHKLTWLSIGDSPLFLFRAGALRQLNKDHSMAPQIDMMVKVGSMSAEVGRNHPDRNMLTSVLDGTTIAAIDCPQAPLSLLPGDTIIAATDGLQSLPNRTIANTLMPLQDASSVEVGVALLDALTTIADPEQDNTAFVVIKLQLVDAEPAALDADALPILAMADDGQDSIADTEDQAAAPDQRKAYWYRGQKYFRD